MKKIIALVLVSVMLLASASAVFAGETVLEDYEFYTIEGMKRVFATSSYAPDFKVDTGLVFDHRTDTGCAFDLRESDSKTVVVYVASRECEIAEEIAWIVAIDEGASVTVKFSATDDADLKDWTEFEIEVTKDGIWNVGTVKDIKKGYAFYRFEFEAKGGESVPISELTISELALFRSDAAAKPKTLRGQEKWRAAKAFTGVRFFGR